MDILGNLSPVFSNLNPVTMTDHSKTCVACDKRLKGRVDKKFCDDYCRNNYNNRLNSDATPLVRNINNALRRNRRILEEILDGSEKPVTIPKKKLLEKGFHFRYYTHNLTSGRGVYYFCYDYGYLPVTNQPEVFLVVKEKRKLLL
jgi:hypothetical protein